MPTHPARWSATIADEPAHALPKDLHLFQGAERKSGRIAAR